jgi:hypothetical protein
LEIGLDNSNLECQDNVNTRDIVADLKVMKIKQWMDGEDKI